MSNRPASQREAVIERLPPNSPEAEIGVLGCIMYGQTSTFCKTSEECMAECLQRIKPGGGFFYDLRHESIFEVMVELYEKREPIDVITLHQRLKDRQMLEQIGGIDRLCTLADSVPSPSNMAYYLAIVHEKYLLRKMVQACTHAVGRIYDSETTPTDEVIDGVERDILAVRNCQTIRETPTIKELITKNIAAIESFHEKRGAVMGLATGFTDLDKMTCGLQPGEMIVIAGRPSAGKTSLAMNIAEQVALDQRLPVSVFSLEMRAEALSMRMLCSRARVNLRSVREGFLLERDFPKLTGSAGKISTSPLYIDDCPDKSLMRIRAMARRHQQLYGIKLVVVDYLQLMHDPSRRYGNREQEIAGISGGMKSLAQELNVPVIVLSQLNREFERDKSRRPRLSDLRESGAIEQDADVVGLLYKPAREDGEESSRADEDAIAVNLLIAKQRSGPTGDVNLTFLKHLTRFESAAKISDDDLPDDRQGDLEPSRNPYPD